MTEERAAYHAQLQKARERGKHPKCPRKNCEDGVLSGMDEQGGYTMVCPYCNRYFFKDGKPEI